MVKPIEILHVFSRMTRGGAEMRTLEILRHIDHRRYRLHFCALSGRLGTLDEEFRALGSRTYLLDLRQMGFARRFRKLLTEQRFDVVHSHVFYSSGLVLRLAAECGTPVRVAHFRSSHDGGGSSLPRRMLRKLMRHWIDQHATHILAVSESAMTAAWGPQSRSDPRCRVIYNGLDPSAFDGKADREGVRREFGLPGNALLYLHVGRFTKAKNHLRLVSIFAELLKRCPAATLLLVGGGNDEIKRDVAARITGLGIGDRVVFCGERTDVPRLLKAADTLIFPSLWEGLPGAVLEACAAGTPVLASDLPVIREIAARLPLVHPLSLDADDERWARAIEAMATGSNSDSARQAAHRSFTDSIFTIDRCTETTSQVWRLASQESMLQGVADG
ncbi:MAG TPA: glycosyltransferase [Phycisphaerae bacterium]|nr:glycosyltransferase [Phycisphaerae bacterium]